MRAAALITEVVSDWSERSLIIPTLLPSCKLLLNIVSNQFFSFKLRDLCCALDFSFEQKLLLEELWESLIKRIGPRSEDVHHRLLIVIELLREFLCLLSGHTVSKKLIDLLNQILVCGDIVEETLRNEDTTVVFPLVGSLSNDITDSVNDVDQGFSSVGALFRDDDKVRVGLHGTLQDQMGGVSAHETDKVPILNGGSRVREHVADEL